MSAGRTGLVSLGILFLSGCAIPRSVLIHDGLRTTIIDAASRVPLADAFVFARRDSQGRPLILARSDRDGRLELEPARRLQFVPLLGEAFAHLALTVCKDGYEAREVVTGGGWNADFKPGRVHEIEFLPLRPSFSAESADCQVVAPAGE